MLVEGLRENGIETMDLRFLMHGDGIDPYNMFYRTDYHYTTEAGFYTF